MRLLVSVLVLAGAFWLIGKPWSQQTGQKPAPKSSFLTALKNAAVKESSGVAASLRREGVYWTHNDSDGAAEIYAFDESGNDLGTYALVGIESRDWEDMASRTIDGKHYLYVGDIGDNREDQQSIRIYRFVEPTADSGKRITQFEKYTVAYPDGPKNAETLMVAPDGDIYVVTKNSKGNSILYKLESPAGSGSYKFDKVAAMTIEGGNSYSLQVTGGDISPDGKRVVVRTYFSLLFYEVSAISDIAKVKPISLPVPLERQGESVCFDIRKHRLITTSEGSPCRVSTVTLP